MIFYPFKKEKWACIIIVGLFLLGCNNSNKENNHTSEKYHEERISPKEDTIIRNVKFTIYCIFSDVRFAFVNDSSVLINYSECSLKVDTVKIFSDTLELGIHFSYKEKLLELNDMVQNGVNRVGRVLYDTTKKKIVEYLTPEYLGFTIGDHKSRYFNPLQPDVIKYIQDNKAKLNPWFREEAMRRGIIQ